MNEYFKTTAKFRKHYENNTEDNCSGLVDGATYDILIKFGADPTQIPTNEMKIGLCDEIITIKDITTGKEYKYSSFNDAFNAWAISEEEESFLNEVDNRHHTFKRWYVPKVYVITYDPDDMAAIFDDLCENISCIPLFANPKIKYFEDDNYFKALSIEVDKILDSQYIIMGNKNGETTKLMDITELLAKDNDIPIIYTNDPYKVSNESSRSNNVRTENSSDVKIEDLYGSLDN